MDPRPDASPVEPTSFATETFVRHGPFVRRTLRRLGVGPERLDDAVQDVFVVLVRRVHDYDARHEPRRWLWGISRRVAWRHRGQARRDARIGSLEGQRL
ncbi:MAG: hypothetical protein K0V04_38555, partial [Deltaproteobacteria bacterium]|nr:hypothetical protein [Deltaproteobacteria bacterium]